MNVLVTGGAGFIGSALVRQLLADRQHRIINVDKLTYAGNLASLAPFANSPNHNFEQVDICDSNALEQVFGRFQPDLVFHLAAESHVDRSIDAPAVCIRTNLFGTFELLQASLRHFRALPPERAARFRFVHVSTDEVFGELRGSASQFSEYSAYAPSSPYSATKAGSDHLVRAWGRTYDLPVIVTHCSNNFGPCQFPEKLIPHTILSALAGRVVPVYGDGRQLRDWIYVDDHVRALWIVATKGEVGATYNIGANNLRENLVVIESVCALLDALASAQRPMGGYASLIAFVKDRPGHDRGYALDTKRIRGELGWAPVETFESGLYKTVRWFLDNTPWWKGILDGSYRLERLGTVGGR